MFLSIFALALSIAVLAYSEWNRWVCKRHARRAAECLRKMQEGDWT